MPSITIQISEQQEAKIKDLIDARRHFAITGGSVIDTDGKLVLLQEIKFTFLADSLEILGKTDHPLAKPPVECV